MLISLKVCHRRMLVMDDAGMLDSLFHAAVLAIDAGDVVALERLLADHPRLARNRLTAPGPWLRNKIGGALDGFFKDPYLLWFVAEDAPVHGRLPKSPKYCGGMEPRGDLPKSWPANLLPWGLWLTHRCDEHQAPARRNHGGTMNDWYRVIAAESVLPPDAARLMRDSRLLVTQDCRVVVLTGTCGSGKSTVAGLLALRAGWLRISEDEIWPRRFGKDRGGFGTPEHRAKRAVVHREILERVQEALGAGDNVVVDATIHEAPPEALEEYRALFADGGIRWHLCVLHPRLEVAVARDAGRGRGSLGAAAVASLFAKFTGRMIPTGCFLDTSAESPDATVERVLEALADPSLQQTRPA
jgi:predicted kinase